MNESFSLGRVAGVKIGANWSLLAIFALIAWGLAGQRYPIEHPGYTDGHYWAAGVLTATVFFAALLAHEMGHAIVARRHGVDVKGITLWLFGGVAQLKGDPRTATSELRIALAGPLVSVAVALLFSVISSLLDAAGASDLLTGVAAWLWRINLMLAIFNMVPAFPLDGGRVFRALLWKFKGKTKATKIAARTGRGFGFLMISGGLLEFTLRQSFDGIWIAFLGYFLLNAATGEETAVLRRDALEGITAGRVMSPEVVTIPGWLTIDAVGSTLASHRHRWFPVAGFDGGVKGIVSLDHLTAVKDDLRAAVRVESVAIPMERIPIASPGDPVSELLERMTAAAMPKAFVMDEGRLLGIVSRSDINRALNLNNLHAEAPEADEAVSGGGTGS